MKKYEVTENQAHNLLLFLDRVEIKGLKELQAMNEILDCFNKPIEGKEETEIEKTNK